jgi:hypothetical protein
MVDDSVCLRPGGAGGGSGPTWMKGAKGGSVTSGVIQDDDRKPAKGGRGSMEMQRSFKITKVSRHELSLNIDLLLSEKLYFSGL